MATILVADDDRKITDMLRRTLVYEGFQVVTAADGQETLAQFQARHPDVVVLDWLMPQMTGMEVVQALRRDTITPVLMLTARDAIEDRVAGLEAGADDYLVKPFAPAELLARVRALLRRSEHTSVEKILAYADLTMDMLSRDVRRGGRLMVLRPKEFDLLTLFLRNPRRVLTRNQILQEVWGYDFGGDGNVLEVYVGYLRSKLEASGEPRLLHTVRGVGYVLRES